MTAVEEARDEAEVALAGCRHAASESERTLDQLHASIRQAASVTSQRRIAEAVGLSVTRVNQIVHGRSR